MNNNREIFFELWSTDDACPDNVDPIETITYEPDINAHMQCQPHYETRDTILFYYTLEGLFAEPEGLR